MDQQAPTEQERSRDRHPAGRPLLLFLPSPFLGPTSWMEVADILATNGGVRTRVAPTPDLSGGPPHSGAAIDVLARSIANAERTSVVLVAHGDAGPLALGATEAGRLRGLILVDSIMPDDADHIRTVATPARRERLLRAAADGHLHRGADLGADALAPLVGDPKLLSGLLAEQRAWPSAYVEEIVELPQDWTDVPAGYLRLSPGREAEARVAERLGWTVRRIASHHVSIATRPHVAATAIGRMIAELHPGHAEHPPASQ